MSAYPPPPGPIDLPHLPVQLVDSYLYEAKVSRSPQSDAEPVTEPTADTAVSEPNYSEDRRQVEQLLSVRLAIPYREGGHLLTIECSVLGTFTSDDPITPDQFTGREALVVLWPYLRAASGELGRMTGLPVPPIPTLDVVNILNARTSETAPDQTHKSGKARSAKARS
jgi:hypothetical protein